MTGAQAKVTHTAFALLTLGDHRHGAVLLEGDLGIVAARGVVAHHQALRREQLALDDAGRAVRVAATPNRRAADRRGRTGSSIP